VIALILENFRSLGLEKVTKHMSMSWENKQYAADSLRLNYLDLR